MKFKILIKFNLLLGLFFLSFIFINIKTKAFPNNEFIPAGLNCLDPDNVQYIPSNYQKKGTIRTIAPFKLNWDNTYYICAKNHQGLFLGEARVYEYDSNKSLIDEVFIERYGESNFIEFYLDKNAFYVSFEIDVSSTSPNAPLLYDMSNYCIINNLDLEKTEFEVFVKMYPERLAYISPKDTSVEVITNGYEIKSYMSKPLTLDFIFDNVYVYDKCDGNITNNKKIISNEYDDKKLSPGKFNITYSATNSNNLTTNVTLTILVIDDIFPVITGVSKVIVTKDETFSLEKIKDNLIATDNYDGDISNSIFIKYDDYTDNKKKLGTYSVIFGVSDSSGNLSTYPVEIEVKNSDTTPPIISGEDIIYTDVNSSLDNSVILSKYTAIDNEDGDISKSIVIVRNEYEYNMTKRGTYVINLKVTDSSGNVGMKDILIVNMETEGPVFLLSPLFISINNDMKFKTYNDVIAYLRNENIIDNNEYVMIYDDYLLNQEEIGEHLIRLRKVETKEDINVIMKVEKKNDEKPSFFNRIINLFKNIGRSIKSFFLWLFS